MPRTFEHARWLTYEHEESGFLTWMIVCGPCQGYRWRSMKKSFDFADDGCGNTSWHADAERYSHAAWQRRIIEKIARDAVYKQGASLDDVEEERFCVRGPVREDDAMEAEDELDEFVAARTRRGQQ